MEAKELRIGNYIYNQIETIKIDSIEWDEIDLIWVITWDNFAASEYLTECQPIPLTEEWLLKFGFEKMPHFTVANNLVKELGNRDRRLSFGDLGTPNEMLWFHENEDIVCLHNYDFDGYMHVHQLQNLYFALTGKELTIKTKN